jgi:DNA-binding SARP family transcriptional activator
MSVDVVGANEPRSVRVPRSAGTSLRPTQRSLRTPSHDVANAAVALTLLQGFRLESRGQPIELPLGSQRLVAFLAVHRRPLQRLYVAGSLWLDCGEERANASLRTTLWRLRQLGVGLVDSTRNHLALNASVTVDLHEAEVRAKQVLRHETSSLQPDDTLLVEGDLLADWYDDWVMLERERHRQLRLLALETLCEDLAAAGSYALAVEAGLACVAAEPLRESAHRVLINVHRGQGNLGEAVRQYKLYRRLVGDQLGLEPSPAMVRLVQSLRQ